MGNKIGMYDETPQIKIGEFTISNMTDKEDEENIWITNKEGEGAEIKKELLEPYIKDCFNKHF